MGRGTDVLEDWPVLSVVACSVGASSILFLIFSTVILFVFGFFAVVVVPIV